jgi:hypothetical protein
VFVRARTYAPDLGVFLQADPFLAAFGDRSYTYVVNRPLMGRDPSGLLTTTVVDPGYAVSRIRAAANLAITLRVPASGITIPIIWPADTGRRLLSLAYYISPGLDREGAFNPDAGTTERFNLGVFTVRMGWIDFGHFFSNALLSYLSAQYPGSPEFWDNLAVTALGVGNELLQERVRRSLLGDILSGTAESAFTIEDFVSNRLGREFGFDVARSGRSWTADDIADEIATRLRDWGAVRGDDGTWRRVVRRFLRNEVRLLNDYYRVYYSTSTGFRGAALSATESSGLLGLAAGAVIRWSISKELERIQSEAESVLRRRLPEVPRNYDVTGRTVIQTPATFRFGEPPTYERPLPPFAWSP